MGLQQRKQRLQKQHVGKGAVGVDSPLFRARYLPLPKLCYNSGVDTSRAPCAGLWPHVRVQIRHRRDIPQHEAPGQLYSRSPTGTSIVKSARKPGGVRTDNGNGSEKR